MSREQPRRVRRDGLGAAPAPAELAARGAMAETLRRLAFDTADAPKLQAQLCGAADAIAPSPTAHLEASDQCEAMSPEEADELMRGMEPGLREAIDHAVTAWRKKNEP